MSIIQQLRDKAAVLLTVLITLSLLGFLVQDAFVGGGSGFFSGPSSSVGSINGRSIDAQDFNQKVRSLEESNRAQGMAGNEMMTQNIIESVWNAYIQETLIQSETAKLGIAFSAKEMSDLLFSEDAPQEFRQLFINPQTQQFDVQAAKTWFSNLKKSKNQDELRMVTTQLLEPLKLRQMAEKYSSLLSQGSYVPKWMVEKMNADNSQFASMDMVMVPYAAVADSLVKVTDQDINAYVSKHKDEFKQEKSRGIAYVAFDALPSSADSAVVFNRLNGLKAEFQTTSDAKAFVARNASSISFFDGYALKSRLAMGAKDSIVSMPVGSVIGPYLDAGSYVIARKLDVRSIPDSIKVRHILVGVNDPRTGAQKRSDSAAKILADSLFAAIGSGASFPALAAAYSEDEGSKNNGGEYNFSSVDMGSLAKEFADFAFYRTTGSKGIVKTDFGYHIMEVMNQKNFEEGYKMGYVSKPILASEETDAKASAAATQFSGNSRDQKSFQENVTKNNLTKRLADGIREIDYSVDGMPSRSFVKWIWDNKPGTVSEPFDFKDKYVVAVVTSSHEEGVQPASIARVMVEPILRNEKKAAYLKSKAGQVTSLEAFARSNGQQILPIDTIRFGESFIPNIGPEPKVIGAAFYKAGNNKVSPVIEGQMGLFAVMSKQVGALPNFSGDVENQRKSMQAQMKQYSAYGGFEALRKSAKIKDTRRDAGF